MKYLVKSFVVTFFLLICTHTFAEQKIVVLDLTYVLNESKAGKGAQEFLKKTLAYIVIFKYKPVSPQLSQKSTTYSFIVGTTSNLFCYFIRVTATVVLI